MPALLAGCGAAEGQERADPADWTNADPGEIVDSQQAGFGRVELRCEQLVEAPDCYQRASINGRVAELADARDLKSREG